MTLHRSSTRGWSLRGGAVRVREGAPQSTQRVHRMTLPVDQPGEPNVPPVHYSVQCGLQEGGASATVQLPPPAPEDARGGEAAAQAADERRRLLPNDEAHLEREIRRMAGAVVSYRESRHRRRPTRNRAIQSSSDSDVESEPEPEDSHVLETDLFTHTIDMVPVMLDKEGFAVVDDPHLASLITPDVPTSATELVSGDKAAAIFQRGDLPSRQGGLPRLTHEGRLRLSNGTGRRMMVKLDKVQPGPSLSNIASYVEGVIQDIVERIPGLHLVKPGVILGNNPGGTAPIRRQTLHVDMQPGRGMSFVAIVPLEQDIELWVSPGSHHTVQAFAARAEPAAAAAAAAADDAEAGDASRADRSSAAGGEASPHSGQGAGRGGTPSGLSLANTLTLPDETALRFVSHLPSHPVMRMRGQPGQIIFLHGNTVHAGAAGKAGTWSPRLHWYVQGGDLENETYSLAYVHKELRRLFHLS
ncbi:hypothetical protein VOLCADRAFT_106950 [Volvox carteri f. nagariensis]|uniref:Phytanoyl-CoA dioxygenase n=1 Tax=Volvox carteri f. nagariensis TaxID=3068 RepID=D8UAU7_VOLCA|nr:uncharacterized protein VOLCADRAFT_106950 [Volvox carteri f. nagariensis]EFJ43162.1 hypothetical protein VOLCADRAFT_106950 [Volvox carteri f. nagariensis]|eukprot:XP_002955737.1 hypothetical protein VOLCADRAFT_106950 [Volvox carteri f. nagariensis]